MDDIKCFMDVSIGGQEAGRVVFKLFTDKCPKTCENFRSLCTGERGKSQESGVSLHYKGSPFHRIVKNFMIQGGDITDRNGKGGESIYNGPFDDEYLDSTHDEPYLLSMANRGPNTNKSQFFITTNEAPHLDGKHVIFGRVVSGLRTILKIERQEVDSKSRPLKEVIVIDCGQLQYSSNQNTSDDLHAKSSHDVSPEHQGSSKNRKRSPSRSTDSSKSSASYSFSSRSHRTSQRRQRSASSKSSTSTHTSTSRSSSGSSSSSSGSSSSGSGSSSSSSSSTSGSGSSSSNSGSSSSSSSGSSNCSQGSSVASSSGGSSPESSANRIPLGSDSVSRKKTCSSSTSGESYNSTNSKNKPRKRQKTNRRLESTRDIDDFRRDAELRNKDTIDEFVNPHYKCSVKNDEIPEVPVNRFLMRCPIEAERNRKPKGKERGKSPPDEIESTDSPRLLDEETPKTTVKISKSGRIMRGRGTFRFRTPSPANNDRSPQRNRYEQSNRDRSYESRSRHRSRSRSRSRSPEYKRQRSHSNLRYRDRSEGKRR